MDATSIGTLVASGVLNALVAVLGWSIRENIKREREGHAAAAAAAEKERAEVLRQLGEIRTKQEQQAQETARQLEAARAAWTVALDSLRKDQGEKLDGIASAVGSHAASLAVGAQRFTQIEGRITGLEERERERSCFGTCPARHGGGPG